ncbi:MAG: hypothetical protein HY700_05970 [Gemmatimonadetes bacterium]|nr:hypothetical protein [Gemmatimonadota bacterium]
MLGALRRDLSHAIRSLQRAPAFTITAILILALGIGMASAMFTVFDRVLLRPLPVPDQDRLILPRTLTGGVDFGISPRELDQLRATSRTIRNVAGVWHGGTASFPLTDGDRWLWLNQAVVTGRFFDVLHPHPALGRMLRPEG